MVDATTRDIAAFIIRLAAVTAASIFIVKKMCDYVDPTYRQKKKSKLMAQQILKSLGIQNVNELTEYELVIATHVISSDMGISWSDVGGYTKEIAELHDNIMLPLKVSCDSKLFLPPKGVLLYGPPGCGKTLIAKALARAAGARFINLQVSSLTDKWYGESNKLAAAVFSLAKKIQPTIIFFDEIDSFLRSRNSLDHEATAMMKALFLSLWDGFSTDPENTVILLGATNRPQDVDPAILRRMPSRHYIGLPDADQRQQILSVILKNEQVDNNVDLSKLALNTKGFSGSDLKEVARLASIYRAKDSILDSEEHKDLRSLRPLCLGDFEDAMARCKQCKDMNDLLSFTLAAD